MKFPLRCIAVVDEKCYMMIYDGYPAYLHNNNRKTDFQTGDLIIVVHESSFAQSFPPQTNRHFILRLKRGSVADFSPDVREELERLGYIK